MVAKETASVRLQKALIGLGLTASEAAFLSCVAETAKPMQAIEIAKNANILKSQVHEAGDLFIRHKIVKSYRASPQGRGNSRLFYEMVGTVEDMLVKLTVAHQEKVALIESHVKEYLTQAIEALEELEPEA